MAAPTGPRTPIGRSPGPRSRRSRRPRSSFTTSTSTRGPPDRGGRLAQGALPLPTLSRRRAPLPARPPAGHDDHCQAAFRARGRRRRAGRDRPRRSLRRLPPQPRYVRARREGPDLPGDGAAAARGRTPRGARPLDRRRRGQGASVSATAPARRSTAARRSCRTASERRPVIVVGRAGDAITLAGRIPRGLEAAPAPPGVGRNRAAGAARPARRRQQTTGRRRWSIRLPRTAPAVPPITLPSVLSPRPAMTLPSTPPPIAPMIAPSVPRLRRHCS